MFHKSAISPLVQFRMSGSFLSIARRARWSLPPRKRLHDQGLGVGFGGFAPSKMKSRHFLVEALDFGACPCWVDVPPLRPRCPAEMVLPFFWPLALFGQVSELRTSAPSGHRRVFTALASPMLNAVKPCLPQ